LKEKEGKDVKKVYYLWIDEVAGTITSRRELLEVLITLPNMEKYEQEDLNYICDAWSGTEYLQIWTIIEDGVHKIHWAGIEEAPDECEAAMGQSYLIEYGDDDEFLDQLEDEDFMRVVNNTAFSKLKVLGFPYIPSNGVRADASTKEHSTINLKEKGKSTMKNSLATVAGKNKEALRVAAQIEIGNVLLKQVKKVMKPKVPTILKGYVDTPIFEILIANSAAIALQHFAPDNKKAAMAADALIQSAMVNMAQSLKIDKLV
jgi:hypothetical protein